MRQYSIQGFKSWLITIIGLCAAFAMWAALYSWFWLVVRELPHGEVIRREVVIDAAETAPVTDVTDIVDGDKNVPDKPVDYILDVPLSLEFQIYLHGLCEAAGVPYTLAVAVIEQESHYDPTAISPWGDYGLMQISYICHDWLADELGITDWLDPYQSARAGMYILGTYYRLYGADSGTLVAYNRGQAAAEELFSQGIYETEYSRRVMGIRWRLEAYGR